MLHLVPIMESEPDLYSSVALKAEAIEAELRRLGRWDSQPLPEVQFMDMGPFGSNTMVFEQWIQFVLLPRIHDIIVKRDEFPVKSQVATYAVRNFDGDPNAETLIDLLSGFDKLFNTNGVVSSIPPFQPQKPEDRDPVAVMTTLTNILPLFEGDALESQLQTFDNFLSVLDSSMRPAVSELLHQASLLTSSEVSRKRIQQAAGNVLRGERVSEPYNHEEAMKKYMEEFKRSYPDTPA
ncbi:MAG: YqcC family protein [Cytophagales bacterium]|nr:YqcC family protein [Cytophagales bacterium]